MLRRALLLTVLGALLAAPALAVDPYECQVPRFVVQGTGEGNVMLLADNSGSMNEAVYDLDYDPGQVYSGRFNNSSVYYINYDGSYCPKDFNWSWESSPDLPLVNSDNGQKGRYYGNYLNWMYYHATEDELVDLPQVTRIQVLKSVLDDVLDMSTRLKFGLSIYNYDNGGSIIAPIGTGISSIRSTISGISATTWTPTGETMEDILDYFRRDDAMAPIQSPCVKNFLIVVTDGYPTMDRAVSAYLHDADGDGRDPGNCESIGAPYPESNDCTDHMDDIAYYLANTDLRDDLEGDQTVSTYVVGYHLDAPLLEDTAENGRGLYYSARNANELRYSIEWALQDIIRRISAGSAVAVVSTERGYDDRLFRGKFMPVDWHGYLESYQLPYEDGDSPVWEAGQLLSDRDPSSRRLFTALGDQVYDFDDNNACPLSGPMGAGSDAEAADLIRWARGVPVDTLRDRRDWILGDIVHSTPVVVGPPSNFDPSPEYQVFMSVYEQREKTVYVGANDGMLHAFRASDGSELWGFVPEFALPIIPALADSFYCHHYSVDGTMTIHDAIIDNNWSTVLVGGGREAGPGLFALDITDPYHPDVLWQTETPDGYPYPSQATIVKLEGRYFALVGSGFDTVDGHAMVYCYDLASGCMVGERWLSSDLGGRNKATRPAVIDVDFDGSSDVAYVGDMLGSIWRIDFQGSASPNSWSITEHFEGYAPITATPTVSFDDDGNNIVYVGTGSYLDEDDMSSTDNNYFYAVIDRHDGSTTSLGSLVDQTDDIHDIGSHDGWYIELQEDPGERITETALVAAGTAIFTSFAPSQDVCIAGGESWLYRLGYDDGGDPEGTPEEPNPPRIEALGEGIASHPVIDLATGNVVIQGSDATLHIESIGAAYNQLEVRVWRETFDYFTQQVPEQPYD